MAQNCHKAERVKREPALSLIREGERHLAGSFQREVHPFTPANRKKLSLSGDF